jgi:hypothetical protein
MIQDRLTVSKQGALNLISEPGLREMTDGGESGHGVLFEDRVHQRFSLSVTGLSLSRFHRQLKIGRICLGRAPMAIPLIQLTSEVS